MQSYNAGHSVPTSAIMRALNKNIKKLLPVVAFLLLAFVQESSLHRSIRPIIKQITLDSVEDAVTDGEEEDGSGTNINVSVPSLNSTAPPPFDNNNIMKLKRIENTGDPIYLGGCCGVGHRLMMNIPMFNYAYQNSRVVYMMWYDVRWSTLFNDTEYVKDGMSLTKEDVWGKEFSGDFYPNHYEPQWYYGHSNINKDEQEGEEEIVTAFRRPIFKEKVQGPDKYILMKYRDTAVAMDKPEIWAYLVMLRDSVSPLVLSFLDSIRRQMNERERLALEEYNANKENEDKNRKSADEKKKTMDEEDSLFLLNLPPTPKHHARICAHIRQGNNEKGDWEKKEWRHFDQEKVLNSTRDAMEEYSKNSMYVSFFIASDNSEVITWFEEQQEQKSRANKDANDNVNVPPRLQVVKSEKQMHLPESGVWFGEAGSKTSYVLSREEKDAAMASAIAEIFALGECDALFIPTYSSFTFPAIALTRARGKRVFFRRLDDSGKEEEVSTGENSVLMNDWNEMSALIIPHRKREHQEGPNIVRQ